ncbi:MAG: hypothetical protein ACK4GM_05115 [Tabrizicola sp.]
MAFIAHFEEHQIEQIRRAVIAYRERYNVGDVRLAREIRKLITKDLDAQDSVQKNVQRLRKGERIKGAAFLNACVQFLKVNLVEPPSEVPAEQALGEALSRFVGSSYLLPSFWAQVAGEYAVQVLKETQLKAPRYFGQSPSQIRGVPITPRPKEPEALAVSVLSITPRDGADYAHVRERIFLTGGDEASEEAPGYSEANLLDRTGVCLPVGTQDYLVLIRDFMFSHMYILRLHETGFLGTMIIPDQFGFTGLEAAQRPQTRFDVALLKLRKE